MRLGHVSRQSRRDASTTRTQLSSAFLVDNKPLNSLTQTMRIHLPLHPQHFVTADAGPSAPPLARIGGELVVVELQGELAWEGNKEGGVIGVLGLDRPVS